jgi:hypothetical protein
MGERFKTCGKNEPCKSKLLEVQITLPNGSASRQREID